jgi:hypothetical protein
MREREQESRIRTQVMRTRTDKKPGQIHSLAQASLRHDVWDKRCQGSSDLLMKGKIRCVGLGDGHGGFDRGRQLMCHDASIGPSGGNLSVRCVPLGVSLRGIIAIVNIITLIPWSLLQHNGTHTQARTGNNTFRGARDSIR